MTELLHKKCIPCQGGVPPLDVSERHELLKQLNENWALRDNDNHIIREFKFKNFKEALAFTIIVGEISEKEWHHPEIKLGYGNVSIEIWTHKIQSLVESDFILAAKIDNAWDELSS